MGKKHKEKDSLIKEKRKSNSAIYSEIDPAEARFLNEQQGGWGSYDSLKQQSMLPLFGELLSVVHIGTIAFSIFLLLKLENVVDWSYWIIFLPLWAVLGLLLLLTQSKKLTSQTSLVFRLAWITCVSLSICFMVLLTMKKEDFHPTSWSDVFAPLWVLASILIILGCAGIMVSICSYCVSTLAADDFESEQRRRKYLVTGVPLLVSGTILLPFFVLTSLKLGDPDQYEDLSWAVIFIPLWITDGFFLYVSCVLFVFTIGARDSALFSLSQVLVFMFGFVMAMIVKVMIVLFAEGNIDLNYYEVWIPILVMQLLFFYFGVSIRLRKKQDENEQFAGSEFFSRAHSIAL
mmetsp:Transcript_19613/g.27372  ORF Transcript_19613/g.27372 Transcript_19613/m.27372 type:complete len:347 (+) Transcript_19613:173-1213(+)